MTIEELFGLRQRLIEKRAAFEKLAIVANDAKAAMERASNDYSKDAQFYRAEVSKVFGVAYFQEAQE